MITLPILALLADAIGLAGTTMMAKSLLDVSFEQYITRAETVATTATFFVGMIKAQVFAFLIVVIGCHQGLGVTGSTESIGRPIRFRRHRG